MSTQVGANHGSTGWRRRVRWLGKHTLPVLLVVEALGIFAVAPLIELRVLPRELLGVTLCLILAARHAVAAAAPVGGPPAGHARRDPAADPGLALSRPGRAGPRAPPARHHPVPGSPVLGACRHGVPQPADHHRPGPGRRRPLPQYRADLRAGLHPDRASGARAPSCCRHRRRTGRCTPPTSPISAS